MNHTEDVLDRLLNLIKEDKQLHDAVTRLINATAEAKELRNEKIKKQIARLHSNNFKPKVSAQFIEMMHNE